jgi:pilus assembly protein CpaB
MRVTGLGRKVDSMRTNNLLALGIAIVMGGIAAFLARSWLESHASASAAAPTGTIVVTAQALGFGAIPR